VQGLSAAELPRASELAVRAARRHISFLVEVVVVIAVVLESFYNGGWNREEIRITLGTLYRFTKLLLFRGKRVLFFNKLFTPPLLWFSTSLSHTLSHMIERK